MFEIMPRAAASRSPGKVRRKASSAVDGGHEVSQVGSVKSDDNNNQSDNGLSNNAGHKGPVKSSDDLPSLPESIRSLLPTSIAWRTALLTLSAATCHLYVSYSYARSKNELQTWLKVAAVAVNTFLTYLLFTVMHDSCHGSIGFGSFRWTNDVFGLIASSFFPVPYYGFKYCHLKHHKHTNDPDLDPDHWVSLKGSYLLLPFQCITVEVKYYSIFLPLIFTRPLLEGILVVFQVILPIALMSFLYHIGVGDVALITWILPGRLAISILAFFFDYLPHYPHEVKRTVSEYEATHVTSLYDATTWPLTWPLLYQNYHNIHHLYPYLPFYLYSDCWGLLKTDLQKRGTKIKPLL